MAQLRETLVAELIERQIQHTQLGSGGGQHGGQISTACLSQFA